MNILDTKDLTFHDECSKKSLNINKSRSFKKSLSNGNVERNNKKHFNHPIKLERRYVKWNNKCLLSYIAALIFLFSEGEQIKCYLLLKPNK